MQPGETPMFEFLLEVNRRPAPFAEYTARELWTDPHTAGLMLAYHLNETVDVASRNRAFLDRSTDWIASHFGLGAGATVADFGYGPGLYAQRLARAGLNVTGIDFSANSLQYARETAADEGLDIDYVEADYLGFETDRRFDLVMMIMCDCCALSPSQRMAMLEKFHSLLLPGGSVLLDVYSLSAFRQREEGTSYGVDLLDEFWSAEKYYGFLNTFKYEDAKVVLDKYTIVEAKRTRTVYNWLQCFSPASLRSKFEKAGFTQHEFYGDVAGKSFDDAASEFAIVSEK
jgi:SAM-dependent methyltransferase